MFELAPEQVEDAQRMATEADLPNFSLAGTGKTHTTLEAMSLSGLPQHLVIAPPIAVHWWAEQAREYLGADARILKTSSSPLAGDIMVTTYDIARNARERLYEYFKEGSLTLDESHYACNPDAGRTKAIFGNRVDLVGGLAERFDTVWCLSGTPQQNHANDLYTQVATLHPDVFANWDINNYEDFCKRFTYKAQRQYNPRMQPVWKIVGSANEGLLGRLIYQDIGAIRRKSIDGLPKLRYRELTVTVKISKEIRKALSGLGNQEILDKLNDPDSIVAKVWRYVGLAKVDAIVPYVHDSYKESPILLGCWHHDVMDEYEARFAKLGLRVARVDGSTPTSRREPIRRAFNEGFIDVLIGQMRAMGTSWNLQEASNHVIIAEEYPSPAVVEQFYKRVYRRGQERECTVDLVLGENMSVDEALNEVRKKKERSIEKIG